MLSVSNTIRDFAKPGAYSARETG